MKPRTLLSLAVALVLGGLALRALLGAGRDPRSGRQGTAEVAPRSEPSPESGRSLAGTAEPQGARVALEGAQAEEPEAEGAGAERSWFGLAVDGETGIPLAEASFAVLRAQAAGGEAFASAEKDGVLVAPITTWNEEVVGVHAPGYATAYAVASGAHRSRGDPQRVFLWRAATLTLRVAGPGAPEALLLASDHEVLQAEGGTFVSWEDFRWEGQALGDGSVRFAQLPARVRLGVVVHQGGREQRRDLALEPGEHFELFWPAAGELALRGQALDAGGRPLVGLELWLVSIDLPRRNFLVADERNAFATSTDASGRFSFTGLAPGRYLVGPSARQQAFVPLATACFAGGEEEHVLACWPGWFLRGRVRAADGTPCRRAGVTASASGLLFSTSAGEDGAFTLGPLPEGSYEVVAREAERASEPVRAEAGEGPLELLLPAAGGARELSGG